MIFAPLAKNIAIEFIKKEEEQQAILLPSDYRPTDAPYEIVRVAPHGASDACDQEWNPGELLVVEAHMIRQFEFGGSPYHTIGEDYVVGWFYDEPTED